VVYTTGIHHILDLVNGEHKMQKVILKQAIATIERLVNGLDWFAAQHPESKSETDNEMKDYANLALGSLRYLLEDLEKDQVDLIGYKDGIPTALGKATMPSKMKLKEIVESYFGAFNEDDEWESENQLMAMAVGEDFLIWLKKNGWKMSSPVETPKNLNAVRSNLESIIRGMHDQTPTRRMYIGNEDAMKCDMWWEEYARYTHENVKNVARYALKALD
jgi:hypothetical protein